MAKFLLLFCLTSSILFLNVECGLLNNIFGQKTTTTEPPTTTTTARSGNSIFKNNGVPKPEKDCTVIFDCKKKLKTAPPPKPCVKYCVKKIQCPNKPIIHGTPDQCVELDEQIVLAEATAPQTGNVPTMQVAMIDFPCQPGYLPDSHGRCREVW